MLSSRAFVGTPTGVSKLDFSDNFVSKNSAQIRILIFTNLQFRGVNLVDRSVLYVLGGILKERLYKKRYRALIIIWEMKVFAHLNYYILLTNCKLQNMSNTWHTRGLDRLSTNKITQCCILFFRQTRTQNHDFLVWTTDFKHRCKARSSDLPKKKISPKLPPFHNVSAKSYLNRL